MHQKIFLNQLPETIFKRIFGSYIQNNYCYKKLTCSYGNFSMSVVHMIWFFSPCITFILGFIMSLLLKISYFIWRERTKKEGEDGGYFENFSHPSHRAKAKHKMQGEIETSINIYFKGENTSYIITTTTTLCSTFMLRCVLWKCIKHNLLRIFKVISRNILNVLF